MHGSSRYIALAIVALALTLGVSCGRTTSRVVGKSGRQVLEIEGMERFIGLSYDKKGDATVKDVTFLGTDGYVYTQEFKDISPLEGMIRWVPHNESSSILQSRTISRIFGTAVNLRLPEDCQEVLGVDVTYETETERRKNLTYRSMDGQIFSREYREGFVDRHLEGWLEVRARK